MSQKIFKAMLFDSSKSDRRIEVVEKFTCELLVKRPGVGTAAGELKLIDGKLNQDDIDALYLKLKENQNKIFPAVNVPYSGLTLSFELNGEAANFYDTAGIVPKQSGEVRFYSQETAVKSAFAEVTNKNRRTRFNQIFAIKKLDVSGDFDFPSEIDKLGQKEGKNYFAIVHVDGNNMALKFRTCKSLVERRKLSCEIRRKTEGTFAELLAKIIRIKNSGGFDDVLNLDENFLPISPLIIGGDDVTFLGPANVAILFTKTLIENLYAETQNSPEQLTGEISKRMDSCAGIAILPTKYPFFCGYELAEQFCDTAKKSMRKLGIENLRGSSWLVFAILHGEQAPTLEQIRSTEYRSARGKKLHFDTYLACGEGDSPHMLENLLSCTVQFRTSWRTIKSRNCASSTTRKNVCVNWSIRISTYRKFRIGMIFRKLCGTMGQRLTLTRLS